MTGASSRTNANCNVKWRELRGNSAGTITAAIFTQLITCHAILKSRNIKFIGWAKPEFKGYTAEGIQLSKITTDKSLWAVQLVWAAVWRSARRGGEKESKELVATQSENLPVRSIPPVYSNSLAAFSRYVPTGWTRKRSYKSSFSAKRQNHGLIRKSALFLKNNALVLQLLKRVQKTLVTLWQTGRHSFTEQGASLICGSENSLQFTSWYHVDPKQPVKLCVMTRTLLNRSLASITDLTAKK